MSQRICRWWWCFRTKSMNLKDENDCTKKKDENESYYYFLFWYISIFLDLDEDMVWSDQDLDEKIDNL